MNKISFNKHLLETDSPVNAQLLKEYVAKKN